MSSSSIKSKSEKKSGSRSKKKKSIPDLSGDWLLVGKRVRYTQGKNGQIIPPNLSKPEKFSFNATVVQKNEFLTLDIPQLNKPPALGVISGRYGKWVLTVVSAGDNGSFQAKFKSSHPELIKMIYQESGFSCPVTTKMGSSRDTRPCNPEQLPTLVKQKLVRLAESSSGSSTFS